MEATYNDPLLYHSHEGLESKISRPESEKLKKEILVTSNFRIY